MNLSQNDLEAQWLIDGFPLGSGEIGVDRGPRSSYRLPLGSGDVARGRTLAKELVELSPNHRRLWNPRGRSTTTTRRFIPIVFLSVTDPVGQDLVASLAHPGGKITGFAVFEIHPPTKWMRPGQWRPGSNESPPSIIRRRLPTARRICSRSSKPPRHLRWNRSGSRFMMMPNPCVHQHAGSRSRAAGRSRCRTPLTWPLPNNHRTRGLASLAGNSLFPFFAREGGPISHGPTKSTCSGEPLAMSIEYLKEPKPATCRSSSQPPSAW